jgi:hypothetical protein
VLARQLLSDFTGGEVSPRIDARADLERYARACRRIENFVPLQQGGAMLRRGTEHLGFAAASGTLSPEVVLIPWRSGVDSEPDILFELSGTAIRGWTNAGLITSGGAPVTVTLPANIVVTKRMQWAQRARIIALAAPGMPPLLLTVNSLTSWTVAAIPVATFPQREFRDAQSPPRQDAIYDITFTGFGAGNTYNVFVNGRAVIGNDDPSRVPLGSSRNPLRARRDPLPVSYSSASTTTNVSRLLRTIRASAEVGTPEEVAATFVSGTTYRVTFSGTLGGVQLNVVAVAESPTLRVEVATNAEGRRGQEAAWSYPTVVTNGGVYYQCIAAHVSTATTPATLPLLWTPLPGAPAWESIQPSAAWVGPNRSYGPGGRGFPQAVAFHDQRLMLAGTPSAPQTLWGSAIGAPTIFTLGVEDDEALTRDIDAQDAPSVRWLVSQRGLVIGTSAGVWRATAEVTLTPADVSFDMLSADRCAERSPVVIGNEVFFISQDRTQLRAVRRNADVGPDESVEASALAEHLARYKLDRLVYCHQPQPLLWVQTDEPGLVAGITYSRQNNLTAWFRTTITNSVVGMASLYSPTDGDALWVAVRRDGPNSFNTVAIERLPYPQTGKPLETADTTASIHLDGWVRRTDTAGVVTGVDHLRFKSPTILNSAGAVQATGVTVTGPNVSYSAMALLNPGFETAGLANWSVLSGTVADTTLEARTGTRSVRLESLGTTAELRISVGLAAVAGRYYRLTGWFKEGQVVPPGTEWILLQVNFLDGASNIIGFNVIGAFSGSTTAWTSISNTFIAPVGTATVRVHVWASWAGPTARVGFVDDLTLEEGTLTNASITATGTNMVIGLPFVGRMETMEPVTGNPSGPAKGIVKKWAQIIAKLYQSALPKINGDRPSDYAQAGGAYRANPGTLRTGEYEVNALGWDGGSAVIEQDLPHRTEIIALYGEQKVGG